MTDDELARTVTEPARLAGLKLEPGLVELILRDVAAEPGALPLLSHALRATWERRDGRTLTVDGYRETGGVASALARTADAVVDGLPAEQRPLARSVFLRMTELGEGSEDSRRRVTVDELVPEGASPETVRALLGRLADARLVTLDDGAAEVAHEALIRAWPRLRGWLDEDRAGIRAHRQLSDAARVWDAGGRETSDLYRGARLAGAIELAQAGRGELNATERAFLDAGVAEAERERRAEQRVNRRLRGAARRRRRPARRRDRRRRAEPRRSAATRARPSPRAQAQALTSDAERVGALAQTAPTLEQSLLFAVAGVELEDQRRDAREPARGAAAQPGGRPPAPLGSSTGRSRSRPAPTVACWRPADGTGVGPLHGSAHVEAERARRSSSPAGHHAGDDLLPGRSDARGGHGRGAPLGAALRRRRGATGPAGRLVAGVRDRHSIPQMSLAFAPDGRHVAVALATFSDDHPRAGGAAAAAPRRPDRTPRMAARRYPARRGQQEVHVRFAPSGALITSAAQGDTIVWNARTGRILRRYPIGGRPALSPDGHTLALALNSPRLGARSASVGVLDLRTRPPAGAGARPARGVDHEPGLPGATAGGSPAPPSTAPTSGTSPRAGSSSASRTSRPTRQAAGSPSIAAGWCW